MPRGSGQDSPQQRSGYLSVPNSRNDKPEGRTAGDGMDAGLAKRALTGDQNTTNYSTIRAPYDPPRGGTPGAEGQDRRGFVRSGNGDRNTENGNARPGGGTPTVREL